MIQNMGAVVIFMIFFHIVDDFYLQGILAKMKQKQWWKENAPDKKYEIDYLYALFTHAMSWSIMISIPIFIATAFNPSYAIYPLIAGNAVIHAIVDDLKANRKKINLWIDQTIHYMQIAATILIYTLCIST